MDSIFTADTLQQIVIFMPTFLLALVIHEYGHAWMALKFGDRTSEWSGRLTLNPMAHIDPMGTILFPLISIVTGAHIFFGWAKPVPINPNQFSNYRKGLFWVAFAGPLSNILLGFITAFALVGFVVYVPKSNSLFEPIVSMLKSLLGINFSLAVFNLIPLPPLDGSNMVLSYLDYNASRKYMVIQQYSFMILMFLMLTGIMNLVRYPIILLYNIAIGLAAAVFGLSGAM